MTGSKFDTTLFSFFTSDNIVNYLNHFMQKTVAALEKHEAAITTNFFNS